MINKKLNPDSSNMLSTLSLLPHLLQILSTLPLLVTFLAFAFLYALTMFDAFVLRLKFIFHIQKLNTHVHYQ